MPGVAGRREAMAGEAAKRIALDAVKRSNRTTQTTRRYS